MSINLFIDVYPETPCCGIVAGALQAQACISKPQQILHEAVMHKVA